MVGLLKCQNARDGDRSRAQDFAPDLNARWACFHLFTEIEARREIPSSTVDYERAQLRIAFDRIEGVLQFKSICLLIAFSRCGRSSVSVATAPARSRRMAW